MRILTRKQSLLIYSRKSPWITFDTWSVKQEISYVFVLKNVTGMIRILLKEAKILTTHRQIQLKQTMYIT